MVNNNNNINNNIKSRPIAITGYSHRLPGGLRQDDDFWNLLTQRQIIQVPINTRYGRGYRPIGKNPGAFRFASPFEGLITDDGEFEFDRSLFEISHFELKNMSPLLRMLLSCAWEAIENAGWDMLKLRNSATGVFIGGQTPATANWRPLHQLTDEHAILNTSLAILANKVSYHFNLMGSSMTYCTACSAGISAMYHAFNALVEGHCEQAIIGAVSYLGSARQSAGFATLGVLSPDGRCNSFDANANGYIRSEGCVVLTLKPLEVAENDGDHIFAVIESVAVNSAGAADDAEGLARGRYITAPTMHSQISLIKSALAMANRKPEELDYLEAHATGTVVGDRIEGNAISEAFSGSHREQPLRVSSVKSNIGHLESAAFNVSLLKIILMMNQRTFAPISKNYFEPNPEIDFARCPMLVQTDCEPFPDRPVVVGINSFGFGGANGHCVISEYRPEQRPLWSVPLAADSGFMLPLSARTQEALTVSVRNLEHFLTKQPIDLYTLAGNLSKHRTHFATRTSFCALNRSDLQIQLQQFDEQSESKISVNQRLGVAKIAMVFAGQGTQWASCGRKLYDTQPVFQRVVDAIEGHWLEHTDVSLRQACFYADQDQLNEAQLAQPVIFMIQCALFELLKTWGVHPNVTVGHSSGEVAAAYASGALSLSDATQLIYHRGQLQQKTAGSGRMLAVGIDQSGIEHIFHELRNIHPQEIESIQHIEIACLNSPASVVVCGPTSALELVIEYLEDHNIQNRLLPGNIAFHSKAMDVIESDVYDALEFLNKKLDEPSPAGSIEFVSSVTGASTRQLNAAYWWANMRQAVNFVGAIEHVKKNNLGDLFLEISPHNALQAMVAQCVEDLNPQPLCIPTLMRNTDERLSFNETLGALYQAGVDLDFETQFPRPRSIAHLLPGHPQEPQITTSIEVDDELFIQEGGFSHGPLIGHRVYCDHLRFEAALSESTIPYLTDHKVRLAAIMPAAGYIELILEAFSGEPVYIEEIEFLQPCPIPKTPIRLQTALHLLDDSSREYSFKISSRGFEPKDDNELHCQGRVKLLDNQHRIQVPANISELDTAHYTPPFDENEETFYDRIEATLGKRFEYGPYFQTLCNLKTTSDFLGLGCLFDVKVDEDLWKTGVDEGYVLLPPLIDGALQNFVLGMTFGTDFLCMPRRIKQVTYLKPPSSSRISVHIRKVERGTMDDHGQLAIPFGEGTGGTISFYDYESGELFLHIEEYIHFTTNLNWTKAPNSKHVIAWQPKYLEPLNAQPHSTDDIPLQPVDLIRKVAVNDSDQPRVVHVAELAGERDPEKTVLNQCIQTLSDDDRLLVEYWLINTTAEQSQSAYDAFHQHRCSLRFENYDAHTLAELDTSSGLLREGAVQLLFVHEGDNPFESKDWLLFRQLVVAGGALLVFRTTDKPTTPEFEWTVIQEQASVVLLQAPQTLTESVVVDETATQSRLVIGSLSGLVNDWCQVIGEQSIGQKCETPSAAIDFLDEPKSESICFSAIDCFVETSCEDPTGEKICANYTELIQALIHLDNDHAQRDCRINIVTQNAVKDVKNPAGASIWGMIRAVVTELASDYDIEFRLIDVGTADDLKTLAWLAKHDVREREIAIRGGQLWAPRLIHLQDMYPLVTDPSTANYRLMLANPGQLTGLQFKTVDLPELGDHDIEVAVKYAALNFRDVMVTLGMLPLQAYEKSMLGHEVGMEASGIVQRTGARVTTHQVGDSVLFTQGGCIANQTIVNENHVFAKPDCLDMAEASSVLSVYVTAYYALIHLAKLSRGQRVLIHSAMGGVGQAAIELAKNSGATIYATAGSESKRHQLLELGVEAVFDSHSFDWHEQLMEATENKGVDVILNSLAGRHVSLCLQSLCPGGWHLEIGKVDIYSDSSLHLNVFRKNLRFAAIDIDRMMCDDPRLTRSISENCLDLLSQKEVNPIPYSIFPFHDYIQALRLMTSGQHQGKLVLQAPADDQHEVQLQIADRRDYFDAEATYLITGGFGGFGLKLLPYLYINGVRHLTYLDRNPNQQRDADWIKKWSSLTHFGHDVEIDIVPGDVSNFNDVQNCIRGLKRKLKGVFHLAGVLDDQLFTDMTAESIAQVFAPKAIGALNLHRATQDLDLDHFVLISSISSLYGNLGQSNYSAASAFLDGLATHRRQLGLTAFTYNVAGINEVGMAAQNKHAMRMIRSLGLPPVSVAFAARNMDFALRGYIKHDHLLTALFERPPWTFDSNEYMRSGRCITNQNIFQKGKNIKQTLDSVMTQIFEKVAELCGHTDGGFDDPLSSFGFTSISVAELGAFIQMQFDYQVSTIDLMTTSSCKSIAIAILSGNQEIQAEPEDADTSQIGNGVARRQEIQHKPSQFALSYDDHFLGEHHLKDMMTDISEP